MNISYFRLSKRMEWLKNTSDMNATSASAINQDVDHIFAILSTTSFATLMILLVIHWIQRAHCQFIQYSNGILFFCSLVTMVADLSTLSKEKHFYYTYTLVTIALTGVTVNIVGSYVFFETPGRNMNYLCGRSYQSIGILIWGITIPLAMMEMFLAYCMLHKDNKDDKLSGVTTIATIFQKIIQVTTFFFGIRHKVPIVNKHGGALFLKIMAIYNFGMWLQSIIEGTAPMKRYLSDIIGGAEDIVASVYAALTTDYRILCSLLFAEIAIEVENWTDQVESNNDDRIEQVPNTVVERPASYNACSGAGYICGFILVTMQFLNSLQFLKSDPASPVINVIGIVAEVSVVIHGCILLSMVKIVSISR